MTRPLSMGSFCVCVFLLALVAGGCATLGEPMTDVAGSEPVLDVPDVVWVDGPAWFPESMTATTLTHAFEESYVPSDQPIPMATVEGAWPDVPSIWPVEHPARYVSRGYSYVGRGRLHAGMDIIVPSGTPVMAAGSGRVVFCGTESGYGLLVKVEHLSGLESWYAHLRAFRVHEGDYVSTGEEIGEAGQTGRATTAHLHYEVRQNGRPVDPERFIP